VTFVDQKKAQINVGELRVDFIPCDVSLGEGSSGGVILREDGVLLGMVHGALSKGRGATVLAIPVDLIASQVAAASSSGCALNPVAFMGYLDGARAPFALLPTREIVPSAQARSLWLNASVLMQSHFDNYPSAATGIRIDADHRLRSRLSIAASLRLLRGTAEVSGPYGPLLFQDRTSHKSWSASVGPNILLSELWRISIVATSGVGARWDEVVHDYIPENALFANQQFKESALHLWWTTGLRSEFLLTDSFRAFWTVETWSSLHGPDAIESSFGCRLGFLGKR
jgi:hypothetical protein